ncbi:autotransporter domain-containing protein [Rhodoplanes sp. SY1]|uniref:autotransporter family protein n=1 Tax=Rhodoplanes sp. SY1 TaxID=3166646 RepID=UPI0038B5B84C
MTGSGTLGTLGVAVSGGSGGTGGGGGSISRGIGGAGGGGGHGLVLTGAAPALVTAAPVTGGSGGAGGAGTNVITGGSDGGAGGAGGAGIVAVSGAMLTIGGAVTGGAGGAGGTASGIEVGGAGGAGGAGISGADLTVIVTGAGSVAGGAGGAAGGGGSSPGAAGAAGNAITFSGGTNLLELQAGATITGDVVATGGVNDTLRLGGTANGTLSSALIGPAAQYRGFDLFVKTGASVWTLTGATTQVTPWTIDQGTLIAPATGALGAAAGTATVTGSTAVLDLGGVTHTLAGVSLADGGTLRNGALAAPVTSSGGFVDAIGGTASLTTTGGTTTVTGANTYTGATTVVGGTLLVNGSIASSSGLTVDAGATVGGTGTLPTAVINGTLSPGNSIGTITVTGDLTFGAGSVYAVEVSPTTADRTNVTGTATLNGGNVQAVFAPGSYLARRYTILNATGGLGGTTFGGLSTFNLPQSFLAGLSYDPNNVYLDLTAALGLGGGPLPGNAQNVAGAINGYFNNGGALPPNFVSLFGLTGSNVAGALTSLSGEATTGAQQAGIKLTNQFLILMLDPFAYGRGGAFSGGTAGTGGALALVGDETLPPEVALAYAKVMKAPPMSVPAAVAPQWSAWGGAFGGTSKTQGDAFAGSHDLTAKTGGFAAGLDYKVVPGTVMGFALAGGVTNWDLAGGLGGGNGDAVQAGVYAVTRPGPWYLAGALSFTQHWMKSERTAFAGNRLEGRFDAQSYGGRIETGWRVATPLGGITPYAALQAQRFHMPGFAESDLDGGGFGLAYTSRNANATRSELGARFERLVAVSDTALVALQARAAWAHDRVSDATATPMFQALPGASFVVFGATPVPDLALLSAGAELRLASGWSLAARFDGELAGRGHTYAGTGTVRCAW